MKFSCGTSDFQQALSLVGRAITGQQALPILSNIHIKAEGDKCTFSATDLELSIVTNIKAKIEIEGEVTVPAKAIANFAQYNSDDEVLIEVKDGKQLHCTSSSAKTVIAGEAASEYPTITPVEKETSFMLDAKLLTDALEMVTFASAKTTLRPVLSGVYMKAEKDKLLLVSTDSYRLSEISILGAVSGEEISCIVPVKVLEELKGILSSKKDDKKVDELEGGDSNIKKYMVDVILGAQQIEIRRGDTVLISRLIEGKFPDYQQIIPNETTTTVTLSTKELVAAIKRMHYFAKEINNNLTFKFTANEVHISTPQTQAGHDETTLSVETSGEDTKIALSSAYLLDFLSHVSDTEVILELTDSLHPAVFKLPSRGEFLHLVMPLRIQD